MNEVARWGSELNPMRMTVGSLVGLHRGLFFTYALRVRMRDINENKQEIHR